MSIETPEYAEMIRRMIRAYGRRLADGNPEDVATAVALEAELHGIVNEAARSLNEVHGYSWAQMAAELGTTRQGAYQRFTRDARKTSTSAPNEYDALLPLG